jgi:hypothetical protein
MLRGPDGLTTEDLVFPVGKRDDLTDGMMMALKWLRDVGMAQNDAGVRAEEERACHAAVRPNTLYPC